MAKTFGSLEEIVALVQAAHAAGRTVYCRYSKGPATDARYGNVSRNHQDGSVHAGLSVNALNSLERDIATRDWTIQQLTEYVYMLSQGGTGTYCWLLTGVEVGRGADNEPVVADVTPLGKVAPAVVDAAQAIQYAVIVRESAIRRIKRRIGLAWDRLPTAEQEALIAGVR